MRSGTLALAILVVLSVGTAAPAAAQWYGAEACAPYYGYNYELSGDSAAYCVNGAGYGTLRGYGWSMPTYQQQSYYQPTYYTTPSYYQPTYYTPQTTTYYEREVPTLRPYVERFTTERRGCSAADTLARLLRGVDMVDAQCR